jgi:hypothetical protein
MTFSADHDQSPTSADRLDRRSMLQSSLFAIIASGFSPAGIASSQAATPENADDARLGPLKNLDGYFPFTVPESVDAWNRRAKELRRQVLVATGLWPMPPRLPVSATIHGRVEKNGCTVDRVFFESSPGLYVTGSLYRPKQAVDKAPLILCPHGHWMNGRFFDHGELVVRKEIEAGAEKFPIGGRFPLQARCFQLAKMGCVVFHYDMLGYADSVPIPASIAHGFKRQRPQLAQIDRWGLFSAQAELRLLSPLGLQTFNSVRALDFALALPGIDEKRVGVTGASGGGTQTFLLMAVDERPTAAFPAVMVSTKMQGGCTCENASYLRVNTGNIELAALTAPKPLGMSAADDWTKELETLGLPELKKLYAMMGVPDHVEGRYFPFPHNYNYPSRAMMYEFFNKHLSIGAASPIVENDFDPLTREDLTVWTAEHPEPPSTEEAEITLLREFAAASDRQLAELNPNSAQQSHAFRQIIGGGWETILGRTLPGPDEVRFQLASESTDEGVTIKRGSIETAKFRESIPATILFSAMTSPKNAVVWISPEGKLAVEEHGMPRPVVGQLLSHDQLVIGVDLLYQGSSKGNGPQGAKSRAIENGREAACFVFGYNHPLFAQRVHDILSAIAYARQVVGSKGSIRLAGLPGAAGWVAAASFLAAGSLDRVALATDGFRFAQITDIEDPHLLPGAVKYGDLPALMALSAPTRLWIHGESELVDSLPVTMYRSMQVPGNIAFDHATSLGVVERMARWMVQ